MVRRVLEGELRLVAQEYPAVTLVGPRQAGKTTLARSVFSEHTYLNLEDPELRALAQQDPKSLLKRFAEPVVIDEIQRVPELLSWIQVAIDEQPKAKGYWILTGSHQLQLHQAISQSLAGRTALLTLLPFSLSELRAYDKKDTGAGARDDFSELIVRGFLPRIHEEDIRPQSAWRDYYKTYVERDVRQLINVGDTLAFERFIRLLAGRVGQLLNISSLANDVGVSQPTASKWLSTLEASFIVFRVGPYHRNFGKRITKSPKVYFVDPGLLLPTSCVLKRRRNWRVIRWWGGCSKT